MELNTININKNLVFDKTLKGIPGVRLENRKVFCAPGPRTKYFERIFCRSINQIRKKSLEKLHRN